MDLLLALTLISMKHDFFVRARHVPGVCNFIGDALSRFQAARFRVAAPKAYRDPCTIPPSLMTDPLRGEDSPTPVGIWPGLLNAPTAPAKRVLLAFVL